MTEAPDADPGVVWEDLGVDLIVVDEAQNYKNLWPAEEREVESQSTWAPSARVPSAPGTWRCVL